MATSTQNPLEVLQQLPQYMNLDASDLRDSPIEATVSGQIPSWLSGSFYSNGSGIYKIGPTAWNHLFDGYPVMQRFSIADGKVTYQSALLDTDELKKSKEHNRIIGSGFASKFADPNQSSVSKFFARVIPTPPNISEKTNINVVEFGDKLFAVADTPLLHEVTPDSMAVKSKTILSDFVSVHLGTSHPHKQKDGSMIYFGTNMNPMKSYNFIHVPPPDPAAKTPFSEAKVIASAPSRFKGSISFTHTFGLTDKFFVQLEQPLTMSITDLVLMQTRGRNVSDCFNDNKGETLDFILLSKASGHRLPVTFKAPSGVIFHFANCYEEEDHVICDASFWPGGSSSVKEMFLETFAKNLQAGDYGVGKNHFARFVLPLKYDGAEPGKNLVTLPNTTATAVLAEKSSKPVIKLTPEILEENLPIEMPKINENYDGVKNRFIYATTFYYCTHARVAKFDMVEKKVLTLDLGTDHIPGETVFVPRPEATEEDDGVVLSTVMACHAGVQSFLLILDASTFQEIGRASLPAETKMGLAFHSMFTAKTF